MSVESHLPDATYGEITTENNFDYKTLPEGHSGGQGGRGGGSLPTPPPNKNACTENFKAEILMSG